MKYLRIAKKGHMMKKDLCWYRYFTKRAVILVMLFVFGDSVLAEDRVKVLLVGDSTTIGGIPRSLNPAGPHLERFIEILAEAEGLPALEVINTGKGGETAKRLLASNQYDKAIAPLKDVDIIFVRMGINDWFQCKDLKTEFPVNMRVLLDRLRQDHPQARIILSTICSFLGQDRSTQVNDLIKQLAAEEELDLFDLYTPYQEFLDKYGQYSLNIRFCPLKNLPEKYHAWLKPYSRRKGWGDDPNMLMVRINDMSLDPILGEFKGWYSDHHPNSTGYNLIAAETVKYLAPILQREENK